MRLISPDLKFCACTFAQSEQGARATAEDQLAKERNSHASQVAELGVARRELAAGRVALKALQACPSLCASSICF